MHISDTISIPFGDRDPFIVPKVFGKYEYLKTVGFGSFSVVTLVRDIKTEEFYACKIVSRAVLVEEHIFDRFEQEVRILQSLKHPNIVCVHDLFFHELYIFMIMDYCQRGELFKYIVAHGYLTDFESRKLFKQIVSAISFIHSKNIVHRDIKPENILIDSNFSAKLADFGLCHMTCAKSLLSTPCGSPFYAPPEIIENIEYDGKKSDIWSLGVVLYTMTTGTLPWTESSQQKLFEEIRFGQIVIPSSLSPDLKEILSKMLQRDPALRPSADEILKTEWLSESDFAYIKPSKLSNHQGSFSGLPKRSDDSIKAAHSTTLKKSLIIRPMCGSNDSRQSAKLIASVTPFLRSTPPIVKLRKNRSHEPKK